MHRQLLQYYKGKKVFVTGHTGFKGGWLIACLNLLQAKTKGYALAPEFRNGVFGLLQDLQICESIFADIRDKEKLKREIISFQPDYIFHLAAQPLVRRSYKIPAETFEVNVVGTANLLEAVTKLEGKCTIVVITTDKVYENKEKNVLYGENDILGGYDPYSASKACTEILVKSFRNSFFNVEKNSSNRKGIASVRAGNVIGGGDWNVDRIFPDIVRSLQQQKTIEVRNPKSIRPWQHVLEPVCGYLLLGGLLDKNPKKYSDAYNLGPFAKDHLTVKELVESSIKYWGSGGWKNVSLKNQLHEAGILKLNISKAKKELKWVPKLDSAEAIKWTIEWYKQKTEEQAKFTFKQISDYLAL